MSNVEHEVVIENGTVIPPWMKWMGVTAGASIIGLVLTLFWGMMTGGFDRYVENLAKNSGVTSNSTELKALTTSVTQLAVAVETSERRDAEFRHSVDTRLRTVDERLETLTQALLELSRD